MAANQVDFKILPSDQFSVYSPATRSDKVITYFTLLSKLRGDILSVGQDDDPNNIVSAFYSSVGGTQTLHLVKADGSEITASQPEQIISGTVNFVSKFTTANDIGDSQIFDNGTNVGIGTTSMTHKLQLATGGVFADYYQLDTTYTNGFVVGAISWDIDNGTADIGLSSTLKLKIGQDDTWYVKNQSGSTITKGTVVYASGTLGASGRITIAPMIANGTIPSRFLLGIVAENILNGADGYVIAKGKIRQINTNAFNDGDVLWVSPTVAGALTVTEPTAPNLKLAVAFVVHKATNGILAVRTTTGVRIADASDVEYAGAADNSFLIYNSATGVWEDEAVGIFKNIAVTGQSSVVADTYDDTLTLVAGTNITITTDATTDSITINSTDQFVGTVTSVGTSAPLTGGTITTTGTIGITQSGVATDGYLSSTDWNTFNSKEPALTKGNLTEATSSVLTITGGTGAVIGTGTTIQVSQAGVSASGFLSSTDWNTFNNKQGTITLTTTGSTGAATLIGTTLNIPNYADQFVGTVTSVNMSVPTGFAISGNPITTSGTLAVAFDTGYSLPTNASQATWNTAYNDSITAFAYNTSTAVLTLTQQDAGTLTATVTLQPFSTSNLAEGTNLYYTDTRARLALSAGTGITYDSATGVITNSAPDQTVVLTGGTGITTSGTYPSFTVTNSDRGSSQNIFKNIAVAGQSTIVADVNDDTLTVVAGSGVTITTNDTTDTITISATGSGGSVTSVATTAPITGGTITTTGTIGITQSGAAADGYLSSTDWNTFNNKQNALTNPVTGTGTTNYVPKWTSGSAIGDSVIYDDGTKVGIGTTLPATTLHVNGEISLPSTIRLTGAGANNAYISESWGINLNGVTTHPVQVRGASFSVGYSLGGGTSYATDSMFVAGNVGIGNTAPNQKLELSVGNAVTGGLRINYAASATAEGMDITYLNSGNTTTSFDSRYNSDSAVMQFRMKTASTAVNAMTILGSGNIGINTTAPVAKFSVVDSVNTYAAIFDGAGGTSFVALGTGSGGPSIAGYTSNFAATTTLLLNPDGGNVGIGNINPSQILHVTGNIRVTGAYYDSANAAGTSGQILSSTGTGTSWIAAPSGGGISGSGTTNYVPKWTSASAIGDSAIYDNAGNIGINTTSPVMKLHVSDVGANIISGNAISTSTMKGVMIQNTNNGDESIGMWFNTGGSHWSGVTGQRTAAATNWATDLRFFTHEAALVDLTYARERMRINGEGNVGIGTTSPGSKLSISGSNSGSVPLVDLVASGSGAFQRGVRMLNSGMVASDSIMYSAGRSDDAKNMGQFYFTFAGAGSNSNRISMGLHSVDDVLNIMGSGNVGIGTTAPGAKLQVVGAAALGEGLLNISNTYASGGVYFPAAKIRNTRGDHSYGIVSEFSMGSVSGVDRPSILFYADAAAHSWQVGQVTSGWGSDDSFGIGYRANNLPNTFNAWPTSYFTILTSGNVGIGTTGPTSKFQVNNNAGTGSAFYVDAGNPSGTTTLFEHTGANTPVAFAITKSGYSGSSVDFGILYIDMAHNVVGGGSNMHFTLRNSSGNRDEYGGLGASIVTNTAGATAGRLNFYTTNAGATRNIRMVVNPDGNVGIGTTAPQERLHVETSSEYQITWVRTGAGKRWALGTDTNGTYFTNRTDSVLPVYITNTGNVGIGTTSPSSPFTVATDVRAASLNAANLRPQSQVNLLGGGGDSLFIGQLTNSTVYMQSSYFNATLATYPIALNPLGGNVGIGTTTPGARLTVDAGAGTPAFNNGIAINTGNGTYTTGHGGILQFQNEDVITAGVRGIREAGGWQGGLLFYTHTSSAGNTFNSTFTEKMRITSAGNVGIGTTAPTARLHVSGGDGIINNAFIGEVPLYGVNYAQFSHTSRSGTDQYSFLSGNAGDTYINSANSESIFFRNNNNNLALITAAGNVGIGTTAPGYKLDVSGTIRATGDVIAYSDARVKENVETLDGALDKVMKMRGVSYNKIGEQEKKVGVIAQEILEVLPEVVSQDNTGTYSVAYGNIVSVLIEAIKEQQKQIDELKSKLK